jgi:hypothetical protein
MNEHWEMGESFEKSLDEKRRNPESIPDIYRLCNSLDKIAIALETIAEVLREHQ